MFARRQTRPLSGAGNKDLVVGSLLEGIIVDKRNIISDSGLSNRWLVRRMVHGCLRCMWDAKKARVFIHALIFGRLTAMRGALICRRRWGCMIAGTLCGDSSQPGRQQ